MRRADSARSWSAAVLCRFRRRDRLRSAASFPVAVPGPKRQRAAALVRLLGTQMQTCAAHQQLSARGKLPMVTLTACLRDLLVLFNRLLKNPTSVLAH